MVTLPLLWTVSCSCAAYRWPSHGSISGLVRPLIACAISCGHIPSELAATDTELVGLCGRQLAATEENPARGPGVRVGGALRRQHWRRRAAGSGDEARRTAAMLDLSVCCAWHSGNGSRRNSTFTWVPADRKSAPCCSRWNTDSGPQRCGHARSPGCRVQREADCGGEPVLSALASA